MKHFLLTVTICCISLSLRGQLPDVSISPDFNFFDINGQQHHLYSYLNQGKIVILNFSPAWCQDCWTYHRTNALKDFYNIYGPLGTNQVRVIHIEKDEVMELADLQGLTSASTGDWITGTPYPIIDTSAANDDFMPDPLPTIYGIYPNKFLFNIGRLTSDELFDFLVAYTGPTNIPDTMIKVSMDLVKHPSCTDFEDGAISLSVTGPGLSYSFAWNNGDTTPEISNLLEGIYRCTISDNLGNVHIIDPIDLSDPDTLSLSFLKNTPISETSNDGSVIANVSGGTPPYTYIWSTGGTVDRIQNLGEGVYSVQVIDANGCQIAGSTELKVPDCSIVVLYNVEATACDENPDGAINIEIAGATPPVTFDWSNGATSQSLIDIPSGGYELTVTDAIGCTRTIGTTVGINDDTRPVARVKSQPIRLYLNENGIAEIFAEQVDSGSFDNCAILDMQLAQEIFDCQDIGRNFVEFTVIDKNLNLSSRDVEILVLDTIQPYYLCTENVTVAACDGIVNYTIPQAVDNCPNGSRTIFEGIGSGKSFPLGTSVESYTYVASDGTRLTCDVNVTVEKRITAEVRINDASCPGETDGSATVVVESDEPYTFRWSDGQATQSAVNLAPGNYQVTVSQANECTFIKNFFVGEPVELSIRVDSIKIPDGQSDIYVTILGGTPPYRYEWRSQQNNIVSTVQDPANLQPGTYQLLVTDDNGCTTSSSIRADQATPVEEYVLFRDLTLGPNPTGGKFSLSFRHGLGQPAELYLKNMFGHTLYRSNFLLSSVNYFDPGNLAAGFYLVELHLQGHRKELPLLVLN